MLMTKLKSKEEILGLNAENFFIINCHGCKEIGFPEADAKALQQELEDAGKVTGVITTDYICNPKQLAVRLSYHKAEIEAADMILVFSCGVGVQTVAECFEDKKVYAGCDTIELPGYQGVTPLDVDCGQCGECYLNMTAGICPIAACSKSLVNGPCGGTKNGKCEVDPSMDCGWERIYRRLEKQGRLDVLRCPTKLHNFATDEATKAWKQS